MASLPEYCPECGAEMPEGSLACPSCGFDEETGWSEEAQTSRLGIPSHEFDYDQFVEQEFGSARKDRIKPRGIGRFWWIVAILLLLFLLYSWWPS